MSLMTVGRNTMIANRLQMDETRLSAEEKAKIDETRQSLLKSLTPWIPGDFVVAYGALLTAWSALRGSFPWLVIVSIVSAVVFVFGAGFAETGFRKKSDRPWARLGIRTAAGAIVSIYAAVAIPNSGWYDFRWFVDNELSWVVTASIVVTAVVFVLKGLQKRGTLT